MGTQRALGSLLPQWTPIKDYGTVPSLNCLTVQVVWPASTVQLVVLVFMVSSSQSSIIHKCGYWATSNLEMKSITVSVNILKIGTPKNNYHNDLNWNIYMYIYNAAMHPNNADGVAKSVDPD